VLRSQWDVSQLEIKSAKEELERTKEENKGLKSELKIVQSQLEETEQKRTEAELKANDVDQLTTQLEETNRKLFEAESNVDEISMLTEKLQYSEQEVNDINTQFDAFKEQAKEFIGSISEKNKKYISTIDSLEGDVEQLQQKISSQEQEIKGSNAMIDMMESTISSLREENIVLMTSNNKMEEESVSNRLVSEKDESSKIRSDRKASLKSKGMTTSTSSYNPNLLARWKQIKKSKLRRRLRK
jgi:chromosome segregation ATPase